jgi:hypothetical protein
LVAGAGIRKVRTSGCVLSEPCCAGAVASDSPWPNAIDNLAAAEKRVPFA